MMRAKFAPLLSLVAVVCFSISPARAQDVRLFLMGGVSYFENSRTFSSALGVPYQSNYASGGKVSFGGEKSLTKIVGIEAAYASGHNNLRLTNQAASQTFGYSILDQRLSADAVAHSPTTYFGLRPYVSGGPEFDHMGPSDRAKNDAAVYGFAGEIVTLGGSNKLGANFGGGLEWSSLPMLGLRVDLRDHITSAPTYGLTSSVFPMRGSANDVEISAGIVLHFGK